MYKRPCPFLSSKALYNDGQVFFAIQKDDFVLILEKSQKNLKMGLFFSAVFAYHVFIVENWQE